MPIRVGKPGAWQTIQPTTEWKTMTTPLEAERVRGGDGPVLRQRVAALPTVLPPLPNLARLADTAVQLLAAAATAIAITGGFTTHLGGVRVSATSPGRVLVLALVILALRHAWIRRPSIWERLTAPGNAPAVEVQTASRSSRVATHVLVIGLFSGLVCAAMFEQVAHLRSVC